MGRNREVLFEKHYIVLKIMCTEKIIYRFINLNFRKLYCLTPIIYSWNS